ncbi:MAG: hypothetical protein GY922_12005, partial [Proteobacteria bacterium]|nr:hypothetical protein [Pseudomonadota bacterium]
LIPSIVLLGCIFPDLIRGPLLLAGNLHSSLGVKFIPSEVAFVLKIFHSPIPLALQAWLFCFLFEREIRWRVLVSLSLGILLHLLLDAGQRAYHISYLWLFPFSFENPIKGIWWSDEGLWITAISALVAVTLLCRKWLAPRSS